MSQKLRGAQEMLHIPGGGGRVEMPLEKRSQRTKDQGRAKRLHSRTSYHHMEQPPARSRTSPSSLFGVSDMPKTTLVMARREELTKEKKAAAVSENTCVARAAGGALLLLGVGVDHGVYEGGQQNKNEEKEYATKGDGMRLCQVRLGLKSHG